MAKQQHEPVVGDVVITPKGRVSYPSVFQRKTGGDYPSNKYELTLLFPKKADLSKIEAAVMKVAKEAFKGRVKKIEDLLHAPIHDGDEKDAEELQGCYYITAKSKRKPGIVRPDLTPFDDEEEFYGGCYARMSIKPFSYVQGGKPGVSFYLQNVQYLGPGERFGGSATPPEDEFEAYEDDGASSDGSADEEDF